MLKAIAVPMRAMGTMAAEMLVAAIGGEPIRHVVVPVAPEIVVRASTAPPPTG